MNTHGYRLAGNASNAPANFIPSLIGIDETQVAPQRHDAYFERVEIGEVEITSLSITRWVSYDSLPLQHRDPIIGVRADRGSYYIPFTELRDTATEQGDAEVLLMLRAITPRHLL